MTHSRSPLRQEPDHRGGLFLQAWAGIGEKFPVREKDGPLLFEVTVLDGDDGHLVMEVSLRSFISVSNYKSIECRL